MPSPFLTPGSRSETDKLALLHLRRDNTIPAILQVHDDQNLGYKEGKVTTTRFGSFPHSTLLDQPWGSQLIASKVDTGSRGRKPQQQQLKRKADDLDSATPQETETDAAKSSPKAAVAASSGFLHMLYPTPETWTASLPHRTQVVYTPDYSYILHRIRARPGNTIIEAGAGSGSFTHASVRAVFNGYPEEATPTKKRRLGKVCSFEFHAQRAQKIKDEVGQHGLNGLVEVTHRDVYEDGFLLGDPKTGDCTSPKANAVFLDLPAPWLALKHLVRNPPSGAESPLDPSAPVYLCTFSPCMEQVQRTISAMRQLGWINISMVEVNHHKIEVRRERYGLDCEGVRGAVIFPKSVDEAVGKMRAIEERSRRFRELEQNQDKGTEGEAQPEVKPEDDDNKNGIANIPDAATSQPSVPSYDLGRLVHRSESDLKLHTSYLVFAILPREWTEEDEKRCQEAWPASASGMAQKPKSKKQMKREEKERRQQEQEEQGASTEAAGDNQA